MEERQKIVIVDDTPANIEILSGILREEYKLFFAKGGEAALRIVDRELPDLVLLDVMMPGMDGYEVCERLKSTPRTREIPIIFITAMSTEGDEAKGLDCGAIDYITKPISAPIVKARVRNHLELKRSRDQLQALNARLQTLSIEDGLTGIANRRHFNDILDKEIRRACHTGQFISLIMCDVDFFKRYNDHYGHPCGDECLKRVAETLLKVFRRAGDLPARYGGEEFAIILADTPPETAATLAEKLRREIVAQAVSHAASLVADCMTLSIGVAGMRGNCGLGAEVLIKAADNALYRSKQEGRNRVTLWDEPRGPGEEAAEGSNAA